jgi:hypothetical protein
MKFVRQTLLYTAKLTALTLAAIALAVFVFASIDGLHGLIHKHDPHGQTQVLNTPDCQFSFTNVTTAGTTNLPAGNGFDNRQQGCNTWSLVYSNYNFSPVSVTLQSAANNAGSASTFGTGFPVQQTVVTGSNPATNTTGGFVWIVGQNAFVRAHIVTTGTGIVTGAAFGWRIPNAQ